MYFHTKNMVLVGCYWIAYVSTISINPELLDSVKTILQQPLLSIECKMQLLQGMTLLSLQQQAHEKGINGHQLINECRPTSSFSLNPTTTLIPYLEAANKSKEEIDKIKYEHFFNGFYVDALVEFKDKSVLVIEADGLHHYKEPNISFDAFRDRYLLTRPNVEIVRLNMDTNKYVSRRAQLIQALQSDPKAAFFHPAASSSSEASSPSVSLPVPKEFEVQAGY